MFFRIEYVAAEGVPLSIVSITGYPTMSEANDAMMADMPEGSQHILVDGPATLHALGTPLLRALYNFKAKTPVDELPPDADIAIWDMLSPPPLKNKPANGDEKSAKPAKPAKKKAAKKAEKKKDEPLQLASADGTSVAADDPSPTKGAKPGRSKTMAKAKKATKKAAKSKKATKVARKPRVAGEVTGKTLLVKNLLIRKSGCSRQDIFDATGWNAISVQAVAKACGLKLRQEKVEGTEDVRAHFQYFGS